MRKDKRPTDNDRKRAEESDRDAMTLTGKISITEASCHPLELVNLSFILITRILHLKERKIRKWGWWRHILAVGFWLPLRRKVKTTLSQPLTQIQSLTVTVTGQNDITKILIKKILGKVCIPPPLEYLTKRYDPPLLVLTFTGDPPPWGPRPPFPRRKT